MHSGCRGTTASNICLQALTLSLSLPSPCDFLTLSPDREPVHRLIFSRRALQHDIIILMTACLTLVTLVIYWRVVTNYSLLKIVPTPGLRQWPYAGSLPDIIR